MAEPTDVQHLVKQLMAGARPEENKALLDALMSGQVSSIFEKLKRDEEPTLLPVPTEVRGFRVRLDLHGAKPPVWRRLELPGDLTLPRLHDVIQAAMAWTNSHLHRFRTGSDHRSPHFVTAFDLDEGDEGTLEDDVRLDQLLAEKGDELWYEYDFGDGWDHKLVVEEVLDEPPTARCIGGRMACPPEDCGGMGGYEELATWVRSGYDEVQLPAVFDDATHAHDWLPIDWQPDHFDVEETNAALAIAVAEPVAVTGELADLAEQLDSRGIGLLREVLGRSFSHGPTEVTEAEAAGLTETHRTFLDVLGDGVTLTAAGYLPPAVVEQIAERTGITEWWIGKANREDLTYPVADIRTTARALGLVSVRKGRLSPTAAAIRCGHDPKALWRHIVGRLPLGTKGGRAPGGLDGTRRGRQRRTGPGVAQRDQRPAVRARVAQRTRPVLASAPSGATLDVLEQLAGASRVRWREITGVDPAVAATARAVIRSE